MRKKEVENGNAEAQEFLSSKFVKKNDTVIQELYSNFKFLYFNFDTINNNENAQIDEYRNYFKDYFLNYIQDFKFITFRLIQSDYKPKFDQFSKEPNTIFCIEEVCIIIESIEINTINEIIDEINKRQISMINYSQLSTNTEDSTKEKK